MKKFVNNPKDYVPEMLKGIALANPGTLKYVPEYNLIMRADAPNPDKVSIMQGSGSGHEPAHVMIVGRGMLAEKEEIRSPLLDRVRRRIAVGRDQSLELVEVERGRRADGSR